MSDLRERVAALYQEKWGVSDMGLADAAIALVLEEAAKACAPEPDCECRECRLLTAKAAAIRALGEKA